MAQDGERRGLILAYAPGQGNRHIGVVDGNYGDGGCDDAGEEAGESLWNGGRQGVEGIYNDNSTWGERLARLADELGIWRAVGTHTRDAPDGRSGGRIARWIMR